MNRVFPTESELQKMGLEYQEGKEYPMEARNAEDDYIYEHILEIVEKCKENNEDGEDYVELEDYIGIYRGTWQARHGFYRSTKVIERLEKEEIDKILEEVTPMLGSELSKSWLNLPNKEFGGSSPISLIAGGLGYRVLKFLKSVKDGSIIGV